MNIELVSDCDTKKPGRSRNKPENKDQPRQKEDERLDKRLKLMRELGH